jgi:uncharacterized protein (TIGR03067 family)
MSKLLLLVLAVLLLGFAPAPFPRPETRDQTRADLKKMQGDWIAVRDTTWFAGNGGGITSGQAAQGRVSIVGNTLIYSQAGKVASRWVIRLDTSKKPRAIDSRQTDGPGLRLGVYKFEGDTLTICDDIDGRHRPTSFAGGKMRQNLYVLQRAGKP